VSNTRPKSGNTYVQRNGLLVPEAVELRDTLAQQRHAAAIAREDKQARRAGRAHHRNRLAEIAEKATAARRARRARKRDTREQADLNRLYQVAVRSGTRARIRADIQRSAEMRALRVGKVRSVALIAGLPILAAFAAWSTAGAQAGAVRLLNLDDGGTAWLAAWGIEPALIAIVALIIIGKAMLRASGGTVDWRATVIEWSALGTSLGLNIFGGWIGGWGGLKTVLPHAIGPTFCALTALLIGLFVGYAADAKPWDDAPRLTELGFVADADAVAHTVVDATVGEDLAQLAQLPATQPPLAPDAADDAAAPRPDDARSRNHRPGRRRTPGARRAKPASPSATSSDAPGEDSATQAANLVLTQGMSNRKAADRVGGTSEASVRRRVKELRDAVIQSSVDAPVFTPIPEPTPALTHGVNGTPFKPGEN
jgi:hypothetical protein